MIKIMTDTTASLLREDYRNHSITPIPLYLMNQNNRIKDLFEISTKWIQVCNFTY